MNAREFSKLMRRRRFVEETAARIIQTRFGRSTLPLNEEAICCVEVAEELARVLENSGETSWTMGDAL